MNITVPASGLVLDLVAELWAEGMSATDRAKRFGVTRRAVYNFAEHHREHFPVRQQKGKMAHVVRSKMPELEKPKKLKPLKPDRVRRITISGAVVTLPRIPTIDGHAE